MLTKVYFVTQLKKQSGGRHEDFLSDVPNVTKFFVTGRDSPFTGAKNLEIIQSSMNVNMKNLRL